MTLQPTGSLRVSTRCRPALQAPSAQQQASCSSMKPQLLVLAMLVLVVAVAQQQRWHRQRTVNNSPKHCVLLRIRSCSGCVRNWAWQRCVGLHHASRVYGVRVSVSVLCR